MDVLNMKNMVEPVYKLWEYHLARRDMVSSDIKHQSSEQIDIKSPIFVTLQRNQAQKNHYTKQ